MTEIDPQIPIGGFPQCLDCVANLAHEAARLAVGEDSPQYQSARQAGEAALAANQDSGLTSSELANRVLDELRRVSGVDDPYAQFKVTEMAHAQKAAQAMARLIPAGDLYALLSLAVLGNSLDFFTKPHEIMEGMADKLKNGIHFHNDDTGLLARFLRSKPDLILYLADNAGEVYFDLPLYQHLSSLAGRVVLVTKGGPALNDMTRADLEKSGLAGEFDQVADTGCPGVGVDWENVSPEFRKLVDEADLIVSKGMANFETLYAKPLPAPVFFLFKLKCRPLRDYLDAPPHSFWALWQGKG